MKRISAIIVTYNNFPAINNFISDLKKLQKNRKFRISLLIIDNNSSDGTARILSKRRRLSKKDNFYLILNKENSGFAKAVNQGINKALPKKPDYILLLNPDTKIRNDFISPLIASGNDIVSPVIEFHRNGKTIYDLGGRINRIIGRTFHIEKFKHSTFNIQHLPSVDFVSGCSMLIKKDVFKKIGLFDERFFIYFEDADFCLRAKKAGFKISVSDKSRIFHGLVEGQGKPFRLKIILLESNFRFILKHCLFSAPAGAVYVFMLYVKVMVGELWKKFRV